MDEERTLQDILFEAELKGFNINIRKEIIQYVDKECAIAYNKGYKDASERAIESFKERCPVH